MRSSIVRRRGRFVTLGVLALAITLGVAVVIAGAGAHPGAPGSTPPVAAATGPAPTTPPTALPALTPSGSVAPTAVGATPTVPPSGTPQAAPACPGWATRRTSAAVSTAPAGFALRVPILMYHRVIPPALAGASLPGLVVPPAIFAAQMAALDAAGWRTITVGQLAFDLQHGIRPPPRTFAVSFDDGHGDGYTYALPVLLEHRFVGTFFVVSGRIDRSDNLTVGQIRTMAANGMEIADHSVNHVNLANLGPAALSRQVQGAAARIAAITGCWPASLAYPYGRENPAVVRFVANAGFLLAVIEQGSPPETWANRLLAPRIRVGPTTTPAELMRRVSRFAGVPSAVQGG